MQAGPIHEALKPIIWLLGKWKSVKAVGLYPTMQPISYCEEISFSSVGQPLLNYTTSSWNPENLSPMHLEKGFLRINPGTNQVAFLVAHSLGVTSLEEGSVSGNILGIKSTHVNSMSFVRESQVLSTQRIYKLINENELEYLMRMETTTTPLTDHLIVTYKKC